VTPRLPEKSERRIEQETIALLAWHHCHVVKNVVQPARFSFGSTGLGEGSADLIGVDSEQGGRAVAIELKKPGEKPTAAQTRFLKEWRAFRAVVGVATSAREALDIVLQSRIEARKR
jgi:hypothetical protein